jgi:hypothetical protein
METFTNSNQQAFISYTSEMPFAAIKLGIIFEKVIYL